MKNIRSSISIPFKSLILLLVAVCGLTASASEEPTPLAQTANKSERLQEEDDSVLLRHNPFYFAYGNPISKAQLSFKSPIVRKVPLYFGYSQIVFWALKEESKPFRDMTYNPELFYRLNLKSFGALESIDFGIWNHNSNGKDKADSRSYEKSYIRFQGQHEYKNWIVSGAIKFSYLHDFDEGNKDIQDFIGPTTLNVSFIQVFDSWVDKGEISLEATPGGRFSGDWSRGGYQASMSFRLGGIEVVPSFYLQYYWGYAETLLNYNEKVDEFRAGVIF